MLVDKLEIIEDLTQEKEKEFEEFIVKYLKEDKVKWIGVECLNYNGAAITEALLALKEVVEKFCTLDDKLQVVTALIYCDKKADYNVRTIVKLFDTKPEIVENIIN